MALMHDYAELINELRPTAEQFTEIEQYWVKRIQAFFTSKPFKLESDNSLSVDAAVEHLLRQAAQRRRENPGTMYVGTVLQHLVAAKLTIVAPEVEINGASVADDPSPRLPTVRPRTVSQNRPRLRPPVSSQLTTPTGSGASSRKRHYDAPYTRRRHCPVPPGTGRSAPLRCRAVRHPICHVSDRSRIWRRRIDARCAERQRSRHGVDAGLAHQADVVIPDFLRPLVGTIVATESDAASVRGQQFWPCEVTSCTHGYLLWQAAQGHGPYRISADTS